jgi:hypothetical protein
MQKLILIILSSLLLSTSLVSNNAYSAETVSGGYWGDVAYWSKINNGVNSNLGLRTKDTLLLNDLINNGGYLTTTSSTGRTVVDTVSVWGYLSEMGLGVLNNWDPVAAEYYLDQTRLTARYYGSGSGGLKLFSGSPGKYGQGRLLNKNNLLPTLPNNSVLPFNFNAAYAYFCAVRNKVHKKRYGTEASYEISLAFYVYQYLHTQMVKVPNPHYVKGSTIPGTNLPQQSRLASWKYSEARPNGSADDISHGGFAARSLAFGADENLVWRWWTNSLFIYSAPMIKHYKPRYINMSGSNSSTSGLFFWDLPY